MKKCAYVAYKKLLESYKSEDPNNGYFRNRKL